MTKRKQRSCRFLISVDTYSTDVMIYCGGPIEKAHAHFRKTIKQPNHDLDLESYRHTYACNFRLGDFKGNAIWFRDFEPSGHVVAHEAFHCAYWILSRSGVTLGDNSEESFAYLIEHLTREIGRHVWKTIRK